MLELYAFYIIAAVTVIASAFVFVNRKLVYAVAAMATAFLGSTLLFFLLGQTLIGLLQFLVFIGGLSAYLIVAVATEQKDVKLINLPHLGIMIVVAFAGMALILNSLPSSAPAATSGSFLTSAASAFKTQYSLFYVMVVLLFATTIGGVLIIRRFTKLMV